MFGWLDMPQAKETRMLLTAPRVPIAAAALALALAVGAPALAATHRVTQRTVHHAARHSAKMMASTANCPNMGSTPAAAA
jgi:hypothetical protein